MLNSLAHHHGRLECAYRYAYLGREMTRLERPRNAAGEKAAERQDTASSRNTATAICSIAESESEQGGQSAHADTAIDRRQAAAAAPPRAS